MRGDREVRRPRSKLLIRINNALPARIASYEYDVKSGDRLHRWPTDWKPGSTVSLTITYRIASHMSWWSSRSRMLHARTRRTNRYRCRRTGLYAWAGCPLDQGQGRAVQSCVTASVKGALG